MTISEFERTTAQTAAKPARLVFFDMDRTILDITPYHRKNFSQVLKKLYGLQELPRVETAGYPMLQVVRRFCLAAGLSEEFTTARLHEAETMLVDNMQSILPKDLSGYVLPGVFPLLERLADEQIPVGLTTGSLRGISVPVLKGSGLLGYFPLTVFGDGAARREDILRIGLEKAAWVYGLPRDEIELVTIGDAPGDIRAGKAVGARTISVATGQRSVFELEACQADVVFADLSDTESVVQAILAD